VLGKDREEEHLFATLPGDAMVSAAVAAAVVAAAAVAAAVAAAAAADVIGTTPRTGRAD
jgi:hypothetical protein